MAKGIDSILEIVNANSKAFDGERKEYAKELWPGLRKSGDSVEVSFLEDSDDFEGVMVHSYNLPNVKIALRATCLDQEGNDPHSCPACAVGIPKSFKGFVNVVWYDAPTYKKNDEGKFEKDENGRYIQTGVEDQNAVWVQGITVFRQLYQLDIGFKGLVGKTFTITRFGSGQATSYVIAPSENQREIPQELVDSKYDLTELTAPLTHERMVEIFQPQNAENTSVANQQTSGNPLFNKKSGNRFA